jgi:Icc-related predicted phosphoesterase
MIIDCISDLHGFYPKLEGGDLLIVAGDLTATSEHNEYDNLSDWLRKQNYKKKIFIAGNHDNFLTKCFSTHQVKSLGVEASEEYDYLKDSRTEFEELKIWGSPWTLEFEGENPNFLAFTCKTEEELAEKWALIPEDTDILVTHSPPYGMMDETIWKENVGSISLTQRIEDLKNLKLHVFGHIHESHGIKKIKDFTSVNASYVNHQYKPVNKPVRIELCHKEE